MGIDELPDPMEDWPLGRLLSTAARLVEQEWNRWLESRGLTHAGLLALHALADGPHSQRDLAAASLVGEQTMNRVLDRLARSGYITRVRDGSDRRRLLITRTPQGEAAYRATLDADVADALVAARVDDPEQLRAMLTGLVRALWQERSERPDAQPEAEPGAQRAV